MAGIIRVEEPYAKLDSIVVCCTGEDSAIKNASQVT